MNLSEADSLVLIDYLDGRLSEADSIAFELRLSREPDLARERDAFERLDLAERAMRRHATTAPVSVPPRSDPQTVRPSRLVVALAATVIAFLALRALMSEPDSTGAVSANVVASAPTLRGRHALLGLDPNGPLPEGFGLRGGDGGQVISAGDYLRTLEPLDARRDQGALDGAATRIEAESFTLPIAVHRPVWAVVLLVLEDGTLVGREGSPGGIAYPSELGWTEASGLIEPGRIHVLPAPPLALDAAGDGGLEYDPGFLVPLRSGSLTAILATRGSPLSERLRSDLVEVYDRAPREAVAAALVEWLESSGFHPRTFQVMEP